MATDQGKTLFELPIKSDGSLVCTQPKEKVYVLTFTSPPDNRLVTVGQIRSVQGIITCADLDAI